MFQEFKKFAMRGNVLDLAIGVIIGAAFGKIVDSFVRDIFTPLLSLLTGKVDFKSLFWALDGKTYESLDAAKKAGAPLFAYGNFIQAIFDFLIISFVIFLIVRQVNKFTKPQGPPPAATTKECPECASIIALKAKKCPHCASVLPA
jgi:large conductance mechanosensitive channel